MTPIAGTQLYYDPGLEAGRYESFEDLLELGPLMLLIVEATDIVPHTGLLCDACIVLECFLIALIALLALLL